MKKNLYGKTIVLSALAAFAMTLAPAVSGATSRTRGQAQVKLDTIRECRLASQRCEALKTQNSIPKDLQAGPASAWLKRVSPDEVNMVTNRREKKKQDGVKIDGKTYYGTGAGYAQTLLKNHSLTRAADPFTNRPIDKADSVIYSDASGRVHYFETEETFRSFIALAGNDEVSSAR
ncbi:MAG: hypothetical protein HY889_01430 [Deltaproteobacteria bacterium]|nr:hypothetical protein [Deltaproteobacteria bacterium]